MLRYLLVAILVAPAGAIAADSLSAKVSVKNQNTSIDVSFSNAEKAAIRDYYTVQEGKPKKDKGNKKTPPGLAKKGGLPPGLAKREKLPAHVAYEPLPRDLEARLPPLPSSDYVRVRVGQDFAIMNKKTRVVFDMAVGLTI